jgi:tetratricopeptide (TPR) repeat protein
MSQRLTRKDIKRDEFAEWLGRSADYVGGHRRTLMMAGGIVLAVIVLAVGAFFWLAGRNDGANELLAEALEVYRAPIDAAAPKPDDPEEPSFADEAARRARARELFERLQGYRFADAADVADVYLGSIALAEGDAERAHELWTGFVDGHSGHVLAGSVRVDLLSLDRQQGRAEQVATELEAMRDAGPDDRQLPGDVVLFELAETYAQLGRDDEARSTYARLVEEYPQSAYVAAARQKAGPDATVQAQALAALGS